MSRIAAVILCGGRAERLGGVNKALIDIGGRRLLDRAIEAVRGCDPILLASGPGEPLVAPGTRAVRDLETGYAGPLAGLAAAVDALSGSDAELLFSLAVDTPDFPPDFVARALPLLGSGDVVLAAFGPQDYPTNALWRLGAISGLPHNCRAGVAPHSLRRLAAGLASRRLDYAPLRAEDPFLNVNIPADLAFFTARATSKPVG